MEHASYGQDRWVTRDQFNEYNQKKPTLNDQELEEANSNIRSGVFALCLNWSQFSDPEVID